MKRIVCALIVCLWACRVDALPAHVQTVFIEQTTVASSISGSITTTAGNGVVVTVQWPNSCASEGTISQSAGDTVTLHATASSGTTGCVKQYSNDNVAGGTTTFTFTWSGGTAVASGFITEISGQATSTAFDQVSQLVNDVSNADNIITATPSLSQASEIAIAVWNACSDGTTGGGSVNNSFTIPTNGNKVGSGITSCRAATAYLVTSATTGVGVTFHTSDPMVSGMVLGTYKAAAGGVVARPCIIGGGLICDEQSSGDEVAAPVSTFPGRPHD